MLTIEQKTACEIWKRMSGFEGYYEISQLGHVRMVGNIVLLKQSVTNKGYLYVTLSKDGIAKKFTVHRLVALSFLSGRGIVNHKDGNKKNNNVNNLEWSTYSENNLHAYKNGLKKAAFNTKGGKSHVSFKSVIVGTHIQTGEKVYFEGAKDMRSKGFGSQNVYACVNGKLNRYKGYIFERVWGNCNA